MYHRDGNRAERCQCIVGRGTALILKQSVKRPKLRPRDRFFWAWLSRLWPNWKSALIMVKPETVIHWHRQGFKLFWNWKSRNGKPGRPPIGREVRDLIRQMSTENPTWGAPRNQSELLLLGHEVSERSVAKYMVSSHKPPSQTWKTFLANHMADTVACDFMTVCLIGRSILRIRFLLRTNVPMSTVTFRC